MKRLLSSKFMDVVFNICIISNTPALCKYHPFTFKRLLSYKKNQINQKKFIRGKQIAEIYLFCSLYHSFLFSATQFMECAYNATREAYFSCSKPTVNKILLNATSFYGEKFPGQSQTISTCLSSMLITWYFIEELFQILIL